MTSENDIWKIYSMLMSSAGMFSHFALSLRNSLQYIPFCHSFTGVAKCPLHAGPPQEDIKLFGK
jgi:hypothetical protein